MDAAPSFDAARLIADVRQNDAEAIGLAYRRVFASELGRVVLLHALARIGQVAQERNDEMSGRARAFHDGRASAVLDIASRAGFDPVSLAAMVMTDQLQGAAYERGYDHQPHSGSRYDPADEPEPQF